MGNCSLQDRCDATGGITKENYVFHYVIGKGGFGKVIY